MMMFTYQCFPKANVQQFKKAQEQLEKELDIKATREVVDVDGSRIQCYKFRGRDLFVVLDVDFDSIIVKSELEIPNIFCKGSANKKAGDSTESPCIKPKRVASPHMAKSRKTPDKRVSVNQLSSVLD